MDQPEHRNPDKLYFTRWQNVSGCGKVGWSAVLVIRNSPYMICGRKFIRFNGKLIILNPDRVVGKPVQVGGKPDHRTIESKSVISSPARIILVVE